MMKTFPFYVAVAAMASLTLVSCGDKKGADATKTGDTSSASSSTTTGGSNSTTTDAPAGEGRLLQNDSGGFSVMIPPGFGEPKQQAQPVVTAVGNLSMNMFLAESPDGNKATMLAYIDYPKELIEKGDPKTMLDSGQAGALRNMSNAQLLKQEDKEINGNPGRSVEFSTEQQGKNIHGRMDFYLVGTRLYQIFYASDNSADLTGDQVKEFFNSFKLTGA